MRQFAFLVLTLGFAASLLAQDVVYSPEDQGVSLPAVVKKVSPTYTEAARKAQIQGNVILHAVVLSSGTVGDVTVTQSLEAGLDERAVAAVRQWEFSPGRKDGKPVAVRMQLWIHFALD